MSGAQILYTPLIFTRHEVIGNPIQHALHPLPWSARRPDAQHRHALIVVHHFGLFFRGRDGFDVKYSAEQVLDYTSLALLACFLDRLDLLVGLLRSFVFSSLVSLAVLCGR